MKSAHEDPAQRCRHRSWRPWRPTSMSQEELSADIRTQEHIDSNWLREVLIGQQKASESDLMASHTHRRLLVAGESVMDRTSSESQKFGNLSKNIPGASFDFSDEGIKANGHPRLR